MEESDESKPDVAEMADSDVSKDADLHNDDVETSNSNCDDCTINKKGDDRSAGACSSSRKKKQHRRKQGGLRHNKKWKPYNKLSWQEKKELEDIESKRACLKREARFASGHPVAPYNTTQFLMEEHSKTENLSPALQDADNLCCARSGGNEGESVTTGSADSNEEYYDSPNDEDSFIAKDFSETYDNIHAEHIEKMTKSELVKDYVALELKVERLESKVKVYESLNIVEKKTALVDTKQNSLLDPNIRPIHVDQRLKFENDRLRKENSELKRQIDLLRAQNS